MADTIGSANLYRLFVNDGGRPVRVFLKEGDYCWFINGSESFFQFAFWFLSEGKVSLKIKKMTQWEDEYYQSCCQSEIGREM